MDRDDCRRVVSSPWWLKTGSTDKLRALCAADESMTTLEATERVVCLHQRQALHMDYKFRGLLRVLFSFSLYSTTRFKFITARTNILISTAMDDIL